MNDLPAPLYHRPQHEAWGCLWYSAFALTGDETLLEHIRDASPQRFAAQLAARGILRRTLYNDLWTGLTTALFWEAVRDRIAADSYIPLQVWYASRSELAEHHAVAVVMRSDGHVRVSDSKRPGVAEFAFGTFLSTRYAAAQEVTQLIPADLDLYPYTDALDVLREM